ncbi:MAG: DNA primase [Patescibacteria group bacterium]|nr:DNA primase [Patescibacteria group bacterium]
MLQPSDEIKSRIDIVDLIREYIPIKAAGVNFRARCPFHREKTPSFMISPEKQIWHCFGCGKGGDIFSFVMEMEGVEFVEALRILAPKAGVTLRRQDPKLTSQRNRLLDIIELSRKYYQNYLQTGQEAASARAYLKKRGLTEEIIAEWQIGYSGEAWDEIFKFLKSKNFKENEIFLAGMIVKSSKGRGFYDRFRGRVMFPINDINGNPAAFSARVSPDKEKTEKMGKYINSPQTLIYDKSKLLFGMDKAKIEIKNNDLAIIVEGQMDAITAHQYGYKNVIASSGTALTSEQINLLKRYSSNIALAFDMDQAGSMAADRGIREAMKAEMNIKVVILPEGKDPDECIRKNPDGWERALSEAKPMMQYYFDLTFKDLDLSGVDNRRQAAKYLLPIIAKLGSNIDKDFWLKNLSEKIDIKEDVLRETLDSAARLKARTSHSANAGPAQDAKNKADSSREDKLSDLLLALAIKIPELIEFIVERFKIEYICGSDNQRLYKNIIFYYNNIINSQIVVGKKASGAENKKFDYNNFKQWITAEENDINSANTKKDQLSILEKLVFLGDREYSGLDVESAKAEIRKISLILKRHYLIARQRELIKMIAEAESVNNNREAEDLMKELKILSDEIGTMV